MNRKTMKLPDAIEVPEAMDVSSAPKLMISETIKKRMKEKNVTIRGLGEEIGIKHPQIIRVTSGENYTIDTLLKILDGLGLEIVVPKKNTDR